MLPADRAFFRGTKKQEFTLSYLWDETGFKRTAAVAEINFLWEKMRHLQFINNDSCVG